jgi:hypothetical protein
LISALVAENLKEKQLRNVPIFKTNQPFHHLQMLCKGGHKHLNLRGHGRAASSAQYPTEECRRIMLEAITPPETFEGGRFLSSQDFNDKSFMDRMRELQSIAHQQGLDKALVLIAEPWLRTAKSNWKTQTAIAKAAMLQMFLLV